jgi:thiamine kinase-like enzyme
MLLTEHNIFYYLLDKGMIDTTPVLNGEFTVHRIDSRNNNFLINRDFDHHCFFIKQVKALDAEKIETMKVEATAYMLAGNDVQYKALKDFLPAYHYYDAGSHVLITGQVKDALSVYDYYLQVSDFNSSLPQSIADILSSFHKTINPAQQNTGFQYFRKQMPWVFTIANNPAPNFSGNAQSADQQVMQMIQKNQEFVQLLSQVPALWQPVSLIHNDAKFNNFLAGYDHEKKKINFVKLIDWELADIGDPLWDVASVMQNYLTLWLTTDLPEQQNSYMKKIALEQVQPCLQKFWQQYVLQMKWTAPQAQAALIKVAQFCALKLIHTCFETTPYTSTLQPVTVKMLQMSLNMLRSPADAAKQLLGIK